MRILKKLRFKHKIIIGLVLLVVTIIVASFIMMTSAKKAINAIVERMNNEQGKLALWLEEDAETYELAFVPVKVADDVSDYFTYVEDTAGNKYMITLPYDYVFTTDTSSNKIKIEHEDIYSDQAANSSAFEIQSYINDNGQGNCAPIKCLVYKSKMNYVYDDNGKEIQTDSAIAIRELLEICE